MTTLIKVLAVTIDIREAVDRHTTISAKVVGCACLVNDVLVVDLLPSLIEVNGWAVSILEEGLHQFNAVWQEEVVMRVDGLGTSDQMTCVVKVVIVPWIVLNKAVLRTRTA